MDLTGADVNPPLATKQWDEIWFKENAMLRGRTMKLVQSAAILEEVLIVRDAVTGVEARLGLTLLSHCRLRGELGNKRTMAKEANGCHGVGS
jgi:hypothetical protein